MTETIHVARKELTSSEIVRELETGNRVIVEVDVLGKAMKMSLRKQEGKFYCDTPMKLLTYENGEEMRACLERYRLAKKPATDDAGDALAAADE
jgi:hypothetical protein